MNKKKRIEDEYSAKLSFDSCIDNDSNINPTDCPPLKRMEIPFARIYIPQKSTIRFVVFYSISRK